MATSKDLDRWVTHTFQKSRNDSKIVSDRTVS
jgi:hypothetical protein